LLNGLLDAGPADGQWTVAAWLPLTPAKTGSRDRAAAIGYAHRHNIG
jgi:hypothetical protein